MKRHSKSDLQPWELLTRHTIVENHWIKIHDDTYKLPNGKQLDQYYVVEERPGVIITAVTEQLEIVLIELYRQSLKKVIYECPAGFIDPQDPQPLVAAQRELLEETGFTSDSLHLTGTGNPIPNRMDKTDYFVLALNAKRTAYQQLEDDEYITVHTLPIPKVLAMIQDSTFPCSACTNSIFRGLLKMRELGIPVPL